MDQALSKALDLLRQLADRLGTTVEQIYPYFVRQATIEAYTTIISALMLGGNIAIACFLFGRYAGRRKRELPHSTWEIGVCVGYVACGIAIFFTSVIIATSIPQLINPHYYAVRDILRVLGR